MGRRVLTSLTKKGADLFSENEAGISTISLDRLLSEFPSAKFQLILHRKRVDLSQPVPHNWFCFPPRAPTFSIFMYIIPREGKEIDHYDPVC